MGLKRGWMFWWGGRRGLGVTRGMVRGGGIRSGDPTASDYLIFLIEDGGLAGGDGALGLVEEGVNGVVVDAVERGHGRGVAVADLGADADGFAFGEAGDGDPVEAICEEVAGEEIFV